MTDNSIINSENTVIDSFFLDKANECAEKGFVPVRVIAEHKGLYTVQSGSSAIPAEPTGRLMYHAETREDLPAVGDWTAVSLLDNGTKAIIHEIFPRKTLLARKEAGKGSRGQIIAANIDIIFIVQGLDGDFNLRRLERYLVAASGSGAEPVILLSKHDLIDAADAEEKVAKARKVAPDVEIIFYSVFNDTDIDYIKSLIQPGQIMCFIGSSGAGKSTLINRLVGKEIQLTAEVRENDSRGRHTTVRRDMFFLDSGGILIDTPGMRELGLWDSDSAPGDVFPEIADLAEQCRYRDCTHAGEPGCAVMEAVEDGAIDPKRYESWLKLVREMDYNEMKKNDGVRAAKKKRTKHYSKMLKEVYRLKGRF